MVQNTISHSDFSKARLDGISLIGTIYDCGTKWPEGFNPNMAGAILTETCK